MNFQTLVGVSLLAAGCAGTADLEQGDELVGAPDDAATTQDALAQSLAVGSTLQTTGNLNLRTGPGTSNSIRLVIPLGGHVVTVNATSPTNGFYNVKYNGTVGWSSGSYLKLLATAGTPAPTAGIGDNTRAGAIVRAKSGVGASYWWGHGRWFPYSQGGSNAASCTGSCPNCSHSGGTGADCSGYVAKLWEVPSSNDSLTVDSHPYSTATFVHDSSMWSTVARSNLLQADALVYNVGGAGHIFLYENGDGWGWMNAYEAKGCSYGIVHNLRTASKSYHGIRHY